MSYYKITSILHTGIDGRRNTPRDNGNHILRVNKVIDLNEKNIIVGEELYFRYITDEYGNDLTNHGQLTYPVVDWDYIFEDTIRIETQRSIYEFEKVDINERYQIN